MAPAAKQKMRAVTARTTKGSRHSPDDQGTLEKTCPFGVKVTPYFVWPAVAGCRKPARNTCERNPGRQPSRSTSCSRSHAGSASLRASVGTSAWLEGPFRRRCSTVVIHLSVASASNEAIVLLPMRVGRLQITAGRFSLPGGQCQGPRARLGRCTYRSHRAELIAGTLENPQYHQHDPEWQADREADRHGIRAIADKTKTARSRCNGPPRSENLSRFSGDPDGSVTAGFASRIEIRCDSCPCRSSEAASPPVCSAGSSSARTDGSRP